jgi:superfamily II DNA or RNA helicase
MGPGAERTEERAEVKYRDYQNRAIDAVFHQWKDVRSTLLVMPTGTGKTVTFAGILQRAYPKRALVIAHREELIFQAQEKIQQITGWNVAIEMGELHADLPDGCLFGGPQVVVSTIQTQTAGGDGLGRMSKFLPEQFGIVVVDEGHHGTSASYRRVMEYYGQNPDIKFLYVTATPDRADEEALGQVCESVAMDYEILDAIHDGWLVPVDQRFVVVQGLDFSGVRTTAGDLNGADLAAVMEEEKNLHGVVGPTLDIIGTRRTLVFAASVAQAERMSEVFNRHRPGCSAWICGKTPKDARRAVLRDFSDGKLQVVCNVGVLTEGFDNPSVEVIVMARPTKSRSLYAQMAGRAIRPLEEIAHELNDVPDAEARRAMIAASRKPRCEIVDFVGNSGRHKLITTADILGGKVSDKAKEKAVERAQKDGEPVRMDEALDTAEAEVQTEEKAEAARRARLKARAQWEAQNVDPFDTFQIQPDRARGWDAGRKLTDKQLAFLAKQGIDASAMPYAQGRQLVTELFRRFDEKLCTFKQAKLLRKYNLPSNVTMDVARQLIDAVASSGWKRPANADAILTGAAAAPAFKMPTARPATISTSAGDGMPW